MTGGDDSILISVVIPSFDRSMQLARCLEALASQSLARERFEVLVVDDGSPRPPYAVVDAFGSRLAVRMIRQAKAGPAAARNAGVNAARGTYVAFLDDDCVPHADWLVSYECCLREHPHALLGGPVTNALPHVPFSTASQMLVQFLYEYYGNGENRLRFFVTANMLVPRAGFIAIGEFDRAFPIAAAEDRDLCERWLESARRMIFCPAAVVAHAHQLGWRTFVRQHFNYGRGAHYLHRARARRDQQGFRLESIRFYLSLLFYPFRVTTKLYASGLAALMMLSQISYAVGYFTERCAQGAPHGELQLDGRPGDASRPA